MNRDKRREEVRRFRPTTEYLRASYSTPSLYAEKNAPGAATQAYASHHVSFTAEENVKVYPTETTFYGRQRGCLEWIKPTYQAKNPKRRGFNAKETIEL